MNETKTEETQQFQSKSKLVMLQVHENVCKVARFFWSPIAKVFEPASTAYFMQELNRKEGNVLPFRNIMKASPDFSDES